MTRAVWLVIAVGAFGACRSAADELSDAGPVDGGALADSGVPSIAQGVALGVFGVPSPDNGVEEPVFFVGCPVGGQAAVELFYREPDGTVVDDGAHLAVFTRTGVHDHVAIGALLVADLDEQGQDPGSAPFVYPATVTSDATFYDTAAHMYAAHVLNPAMASFNNLGAWNTDTLVSCP